MPPYRGNGTPDPLPLDSATCHVPNGALCSEPMQFRLALAALRTTKGLSVTRFADACGLRYWDISKLESGRNRASSAHIRDGLAKGFGVGVGVIKDLVEGMPVDRAAREFGVPLATLRAEYARAEQAALPPEAA